MTKLIIDKIDKTYGKSKILNSINLEIDSGLFGLLGPNGAGKTTMMRILATLVKPDKGEIIYNDIKWSKDPDKVRKIIGYLPQEFGIFKNITAFESLDYIATLKGIEDKSKRHIHIETLLDQVNLLSEKNTKVGKFSGGMKRRLGIAQALLGEPQIVIVDEPTAGLDPEERIRFRNLLRKLSINKIVILSTHIVEDIEATCNAVAVINKGNVTKFDSLQELATLAENQVWEWKIKQNDFEKIQKIDSSIISTQVTADYITLRVLSDERPSEDAKLTNPTIEEGYIVWNKR